MRKRSVRVGRIRFRVALAVAAGAALVFGGFSTAGPFGMPPLSFGSKRAGSVRIDRVSGPQRQRSNSQTFTDRAGDSGKGSDITTVTVLNDDAGTFVFDVILVNRDVWVGDSLVVFLDADQDPSEGTGGDWDYAIVVVGGQPYLSIKGGDVGYYAPTLRFSYLGGERTITVNRSDLPYLFDRPEVNGFHFVVAAYDGLGTDDAGPWNYQFVLGTPPTTATATATTATTTTTASAPTRTVTVPLAPVIGRPVLLPARVVAGRRATVSFYVSRSDDQKPLLSGKMIANPAVGGTVLRHSESFRNGIARLSFLIPKSARGKQLTVNLTITAPSYRKEGTYVDPVTGQAGNVHTTYKGRSATKLVRLAIRF